MASGALGTALRHLRDLFRGGTVVGLADGQLLARYADSNDGVAFEALVARHGPMVLATCRAVLGHEHDVEDAFQATFLVLARKARSVRAGDALGGWLHRVAYRVAVQASVEARRRRLRESEVLAMATPDVSRPGPESDLRSVLHEEIDRLPEGQRLPVVLCDLEGLTYEEAARRLRWTVPTFRCRLAKARKRLRARLTRRGVTAALGALIAPRAASAAVPAAWTRAAVASATGGATSAAVATLTRTIIRGMLMTKLKIASTAALAAVALVSAGVVAVGAWRPDEPNPPAEAKAPPAARNDPSPETGAVAVRGRVVGPDGQPVPGATLRAAFLDMDDRRKPETASGPDGRFLMGIPRPDQSMLTLNGGPTFPWLIASAPGFGPVSVPSVLKAGAEGELTVRLVEDGPPIEGRIVDLEGRPVAGAKVKVERIWYPFVDRRRYAETGDLSAWIKVVNESGVQGPWDGLEQLPTTITTTTGPDGRFRLTGIGRERVAYILVSGPSIATTQLFAMSRNGPEARCIDRAPGGPKTLVFHSPKFEHAVPPTKPIEGVIRDKDSGRPIAGVKLQAAVFVENSLLWERGIEATTDARGRYRLSGLPKGPAYRIFVNPGVGQPYPKATLRAPADSPALEPVTFDIALKRGILVRGRVTDKATGKPVPGYVEAYAFSDNPFVGEFPGYAESYPPHVYLKDDGRYEVVALPGRNLIASRSDMRGYRGGIGAEAIEGYDPKSRGFKTLPRWSHVENYHVLTSIDLDPKAVSATLDLQVDPGRSVTVMVVDPEGEPIAGTTAMGLRDLFPTSDDPLESPTFEVHGLDPSTPRRVTITHAGRKLIGSVHLKGDEAGPLTVQLQPSGAIAGRIVDDEGKPRGGLWLRHGSSPNRPDEGEILGTRSEGAIEIGSDGRFQVDGLVPGLEYGVTVTDKMHILAGRVLFRDLTVAPGEVKDLGDLKFVPRKGDNQP